MQKDHPGWRTERGACPTCVQEALLRVLLRRSDAVAYQGQEGSQPPDDAAAFGALPTPLRMHADPRYTGRGVTLALVDAGFHPHPDLVEPANRVRAWVDAAVDPPVARFFGPDEIPAWPGSGAGAPPQWHGLMTSAVAAGNGRLSHGFYRGLGSESNLVLIQVREPSGHISSGGILRALQWILDHGPGLGVQVVSLSVGGDDGPLRRDEPVDRTIDDLTAIGVLVVAAAGNDGQRRLVPPATAPAALTVGGLDDKNTFDHDAMELWHSNYGAAATGEGKPELVAPSLWVVAPILPGTRAAEEAASLFAARARGESDKEERLARLKLITPHYHHVDGTSVAAPLVASVAACMLQANGRLTPALLRRNLLRACRPVPGAPRERQGAGAVDAGVAVMLALREGEG